MAITVNMYIITRVKEVARFKSKVIFIVPIARKSIGPLPSCWHSPEGQRDEAGTMVEERSNRRNGMMACERERGRRDGDFKFKLLSAPNNFHRSHSLLSCAG